MSEQRKQGSERQSTGSSTRRRRPQSRTGTSNMGNAARSPQRDRETEQDDTEE